MLHVTRCILSIPAKNKTSISSHARFTYANRSFFASVPILGVIYKSVPVRESHTSLWFNCWHWYRGVSFVGWPVVGGRWWCSNRRLGQCCTLTIKFRILTYLLHMKPGLEPDQAQARPGPLLRVGLDIWQAWARPSPAQARALSPSRARHITTFQ
jgi:hypothetical protein